MHRETYKTIEVSLIKLLKVLYIKNMTMYDANELENLEIGDPLMVCNDALNDRLFNAIPDVGTLFSGDRYNVIESCTGAVSNYEYVYERLIDNYQPFSLTKVLNDSAMIGSTDVDIEAKTVMIEDVFGGKCILPHIFVEDAYISRFLALVYLGRNTIFIRINETNFNAFTLLYLTTPELKMKYPIAEILDPKLSEEDDD